MSDNKGFKVLAIRPLKDCPESFRKNLKPGVIYKFYQNYRFLDSADKEICAAGENLTSEVQKITCINSSDYSDLYSKKDGPRINISAIVGKNGSGKSALLEFIYAAGFIIAEYGQKVNTDNHNEDISNLKKTVFFEIYYELDGTYYKFKNVKNSYNEGKDEHRVIKVVSVQSDEKELFKSFPLKSIADTRFENKNLLTRYFYSIVVNNSMYGLNSRETPFLGALFPKNDGYQLPVVLNPYRKEGVIDINNEYSIGQSRILANAINLDFSEIVNSKKLESIEFQYYFSKLGLQGQNGLLERVKRLNEIYPINSFLNKIIREISGNSQFSISKSLLESFNFYTDQIDVLIRELDEEKLWIEFKVQLMYYLVYKIFKLTETDYRYGRLVNQSMLNCSFEQLDNLIEEISVDNSHLTFKIHQAVNLIFYNTLDGGTIKYDNGNNIVINIAFSVLKDRIKKISKNSATINHIPLAFAKVNFNVSTLVEEGTSHKLTFLSSGEQQKLFSIAAIQYHIRNLTSIKESTFVIEYNCINLILDEIELYYHPEFQRKFISELLDSIHSMKLPNNISINIILATHSPFILSDIPSTNVLKLKNGNPEGYNIQTFGANIHYLLSDSFFLNEGTMGEFSREYVLNVLSEINAFEGKNITYSEKEKLEGKINLIGEKIIRVKLFDKLNDIPLLKNEMDEEIQILKERISRLEKRKSEGK